MSIKKSSDTIGNRTRKLPACSTVPQPTALLRAPQQSNKDVNLRISLSKSSEITFWLKWQRITVTRFSVK